MDKFFWKFHEVKGLWPHCKYTMSIIHQNHVCSWWWTTKFSGSSHHSVTTHLYSDYSRVLYHYVCITVRLVFFIIIMLLGDKKRAKVVNSWFGSHRELYQNCLVWNAFFEKKPPCLITVCLSSDDASVWQRQNDQHGKWSKWEKK